MCECILLKLPSNYCIMFLSADSKPIVSNSPHQLLDVERNDRFELKMAMRRAKKRKLDPKMLIQKLYRNTFFFIEGILIGSEQHFNNIVRALRGRIEHGEGVAEVLTDACTVKELIEKLDISGRWFDIDLVKQMVFAIPGEPGNLALDLLEWYYCYLDTYNSIVNVEDPNDVLALPEMTCGTVRFEVTVDQEFKEFTKKDCRELFTLVLCTALNIPQNMAAPTQAWSGDSTTVAFIVSKAFMQNIILYSVEATAVWAYQELHVTRLRIPGLFEMNVSQLLTQHLRQAIYNGLIGNMDFVGTTKVRYFWSFSCTYNAMV